MKQVEKYKVSDREILDLWKTTEHTTGVYVHSAFCKEQCTYCNFKGTIFGYDNHEKYVKEYLPSMLEFYKDILEKPYINGYFWGGGTPSLMSSSEMDNIFKIIPNFKSQKNKLMEMHVCDWHEEQTDVLKDHRFNILIACIQTFDRETLKKYGRRVPKDRQGVFDNIQYAHSQGLNVSSDLLYLDTGNQAVDSSRLMNDMQLLADNNISEITIQTLFDEVGKFDNIVTAIAELFLGNNPEYAMYNTFFRNGAGVDIPIMYRPVDGNIADHLEENKYIERRDNRCVTLRIVRRDKDPDEMFHWSPAVDEMTKWPLNITPQWSNTLGIGSYKNYKNTFSTIEDRIEYIEVGNLDSPEFYITYNKDDYKFKDLVAEFYNDVYEATGQDPPDGTAFYFSTCVKGVDEFSVNKKLKRELIIGLQFPDNAYINEFLIKYKNKLIEAWPDLSKKWKFTTRPLPEPKE